MYGKFSRKLIFFSRKYFIKNKRLLPLLRKKHRVIQPNKAFKIFLSFLFFLFIIALFFIDTCGRRGKKSVYIKEYSKIALGFTST